MRGIAASRKTLGPADLDEAVDAAFKAFDEFIEQWVGKAAHQLAFNGEHEARVRDASDHPRAPRRRDRQARQVDVRKRAENERICPQAATSQRWRVDSGARQPRGCPELPRAQRRRSGDASGNYQAALDCGGSRSSTAK